MLKSPRSSVTSGRELLGLALFYLGFVIYGSLVPLDFHSMPLDQAWSRFVSILYQDLSIDSWTDWTANILLGIPLAFLWQGVIWPRRNVLLRLLSALVIWILCLILSTGVEFAQLFFPPRVIAKKDIVAQSIGAILGIVVWWWQGPSLWAWVLEWKSARGPVQLAEKLLWVYFAVLLGYSVLPLDLTISPVEIYHHWYEGGIRLNPFTISVSDPVQLIYDLGIGVILWIPVSALWVLSGRKGPLQAWRWTVLAATSIEVMRVFIYSQICATEHILTAMLGAALGTWIASHWRRIAPQSAPEVTIIRNGVTKHWFAFTLLAVVIFAVYRYPLEPDWLAVGLTSYAVLLWRYPAAWLVVVPALLPILDLTVWSGHFFFNEFDIVILLTVAIVWWRLPVTTGEQVLFPGAGFVIGMVALVQLLSTVIGLFPLAPLDTNAFANYYSPYNSLRISKGFWWALLLLLLLRREVQRGTPVNRLFSIGMLAGLAGTALAIAWERAPFPGLFNFDHAYRAAGSFSGMPAGGALVAGYLAAALPFVMACFLSGWGVVACFTGIGIATAALYGILVTFAPIDYLAFIVTGLVLCGGGILLVKRSRGIKPVLSTRGIMLVIIIIMALPIVKGCALTERFPTATESLQTHLRHWRLTLSMINDDWITVLFGMGKGSFPRTYFWKGNQTFTPATYQYLMENNHSFLRLGSGGSLRLGQRISLTAGDPYTLDMDLRGARENGSLIVSLCENAVLYPASCKPITIRMNAPPGEWQHYQTIINTGSLGKDSWYLRRPVELSLYNDQPGFLVDIGNIRLTPPAGSNLIKNGDFSAGQDYWFFSTDSALPWQSQNLWVQVLFEEGWLGLVVFIILLVYIVSILYERLRSGDRFALLLAASLTGFLAIGVSASLFDEPRLTLLFFLIVWLAILNPTQLVGFNRQGSLRQQRGQTCVARP